MSSRRTLGFASPFGVSSSNKSSVTRGTFVAFSSPTSISTLIVPPHSLRVNLFHLPQRPRQVRARLIEAVQRRNLVLVRAGQRILRLDHFNIVRDPRIEAVPRLIHFFFRKLHPHLHHPPFPPPAS